MSQTEQVSFSRSKTVFSVGLNCYDGSDGTKATDLLKVNHYYVIKALQPDNKYKKTFVNLILIHAQKPTFSMNMMKLSMDLK